MKKSHWIILIVLVILLALYLFARTKQPLEKETRFFKADSVDIAKLEFFTLEDTIIISKKDNEWKLTYPVEWDVNKEQLGFFFSRF